MFTQKDLDKVKRAVLRKYDIAAGVAFDGLEIKLSENIDTACVVGERDAKGVLQVKEILVNPKFFANLTFAQRVFVLAHEAFHIALRHFSRAMDMPEKDALRKYKEYCQTEKDETKRAFMKEVYLQRYHELWNIATDACINAFLKRDGLVFPEGVKHPTSGKEMKFVDMEEGLYQSAEKIYKYLVQKQEEKEKEEKEKEEKEKEKQNQQDNQNQQGNQSQQGNQTQQNNQDSQEGEMQPNKTQPGEGNQSGQGESSQDSQGNDQSEMPELGDNNQSGTGKPQKPNGSQPQKSKSSHPSLDDINPDDYVGIDSHEEWNGDEKDDSKSKGESTSETEEDKSNDSEENTDEGDLFDQILKERDKKQPNRKSVTKSLSKIRSDAGAIDEKNVKSLLSWRTLLVGQLEGIEEAYGMRRASRFNPNPRIEERLLENLPNVEIILDTSGSISSDLLRGFLLQLVPIFNSIYGEDVSIKVGCFGDDFSGFTPIRSLKDIQEFQPTAGGGTDFEVAATSFSPDPGNTCTKIVFTDGILGFPQKTKVKNIIWIVFGNGMNFQPVSGRIIRISQEDYDRMIQEGQQFIAEDGSSFGHRR